MGCNARKTNYFEEDKKLNSGRNKEGMRNPYITLIEKKRR
jgi:hypothetical protein